MLVKQTNFLVYSLRKKYCLLILSFFFHSKFITLKNTYARNVKFVSDVSISNATLKTCLELTILFLSEYNKENCFQKTFIINCNSFTHFLKLRMNIFGCEKNITNKVSAIILDSNNLDTVLDTADSICRRYSFRNR